MTKSKETVNVQHLDNGVEAIALDRRKFIKGLGFAVLTAQCLSLINCASENSPSEGHQAVDNLIIHSSSGTLSHVHDLLIPYAILSAPPFQGVELKTTQAMFHRHPVVLTQEQLKVVNQGGSVTQKAGSHLFVIALAKRPDQVSGGIRQSVPWK
ncbi:MAG: hypothetical protein ABIP75_06935 [Pyrinomonadaceae bacterium]